jgi:hypothetical protein
LRMFCDWFSSSRDALADSCAAEALRCVTLSISPMTLPPGRWPRAAAPTRPASRAGGLEAADLGEDAAQLAFHFLAQGRSLLNAAYGVPDHLVCRLRGLCALAGQRAHLFGDDGEPCARLPARAASTAAFSASRLVWKAISSMVLAMLAICELDS